MSVLAEKASAFIIKTGIKDSDAVPILIDNGDGTWTNGRVSRAALLAATPATFATTSGTINADFANTAIQMLGMTGSVAMHGTGMAAGLRAIVYISNTSGSDQAMTFDSNWHWLGTNYSAGVTCYNNKVAVLSLTAFGTTAASVVAVYVAEP
jgi:hypothetical protein